MLARTDMEELLGRPWLPHQWKLRLWLESQLRGAKPLVFAPAPGGQFIVDDGLAIRPRSPHMRYLWNAVAHPGVIVFPQGERQTSENFSHGLRRARKHVEQYSPDLATELLKVHRVWGRALRYDPDHRSPPIATLVQHCIDGEPPT